MPREGRRAGALRPVSTLLCRVKRRLPVAVVNLYGTFDETSAVSGVLSLRERLAEQPMALVVDATHLNVVAPALPALLDLADDAARWPGVRIAMCGAPPAVRSLLAGAADPAPTPAGIDLFDRIEDAVAVALKAPLPARQSVRLAPDRHAPEQARHFVQDACREWGIGRLGRLSAVIVSELVTNGVLHARTPLELTVRLSGADLYLAVRDGDPRLLASPGAGVAEDSGYGRGLLIVDGMADGWGCAPTGEGKVVWAHLAVPDGSGFAKAVAGD
jgi:hypothetical protein